VNSNTMSAVISLLC